MAHIVHCPPSRSRVRVRRLALPALLVAAAAAAAATGALGHAPSSETERQIAAEIDDMLAAGVPPDSPKVRLLEEQLEAMRAGNGVDARHEPGVDTGARLAEAEAATRAQARAEAAGRGGDAIVVPGEGPRWESGTVPCEPVPGMLGVEEVAGATCLSVPQPDGTARYVAVAADGTVRSVRFGTDGDVRRLPDVGLATGPPGRGAVIVPTPAGDLEIAPPAGSRVSVDLR